MCSQRWGASAEDGADREGLGRTSMLWDEPAPEGLERAAGKKSLQDM
jgi:hypothetical protein